jgi:HTH-type transcriptional regulator/antitoxin HigA
MKAKIIKSEKEYKAMLRRVEELMDAAPGSPEEEELELLGLLVETYEQEHYSIDLPDPVETIKFFMDQKGLCNADMVRYFGHISKVSEVLNGKRSLSKAMIRNLVGGLGIPAEILLEVSGTPKAGMVYPLPDEQVMRVAEKSGEQ